MIKSITVKNYLEESLKITLTDSEPDHGLLLISATGLGANDATVNTTPLATTDGSIYNSARANERNIVLKFRFVLAPSIEATRQRTYRYFPVKRQLELIVETDERTIGILGNVESNEADIFSKQEGCSISILCPDPFFYSINRREEVFSGVEPLFEFPFENESLDEPTIEFGEIKDYREQTIWYDGDEEVGITINIHANSEVKGLIIYNAKNRETMRIDSNIVADLTGDGIKKGDDVIICTERRNKSVTLLRNGYYKNIINALERGSDWFKLAKGDNIFAFYADEGMDELTFTITYRKLYTGI